MHAAVTAVGTDRPGIVAAVSRVLFEQGANIEDSRMAILGGHFAMVLVVALGSSSAESLEQALAGPARQLDLVISVRPLEGVATSDDDGEPFSVSVYGADRPGIVARVSETLAALGVNIRDLATHVVGTSPPVYVMILEVTLPPGADAGAVEGRLKDIAGELGVDVSMRAEDADTL